MQQLYKGRLFTMIKIDDAYAVGLILQHNNGAGFLLKDYVPANLLHLTELFFNKTKHSDHVKHLVCAKLWKRYAPDPRAKRLNIKQPYTMP